MGVKFAHALGAHTVVFTTSPGKRRPRSSSAPTRSSSPARRRDGKARRELRLHPRLRRRRHDINAYIALLKRDGNITLVGAPEKPLSVAVFACSSDAAAFRAPPLAASPKPRRCSTFAAPQHHRRRRSRRVQQINEAYERMVRSDVKYRFSIDMASLKSE